VEISNKTYSNQFQTASSVPKDASLAVVVLNYNTWELALNCLNKALELEGDEIAEYVLFDDGSTLGKPDDIPVDPRITIVHGGANRGFSGALNEAFKHVAAEIIVLFDSDALPLRRFSAIIRNRFFSNHRLGVLGFHGLRRDGGPSETFFPSPGQWSLILGQSFHAALLRFRGPDAIHPKGRHLCVITGCMATRRTAYQEVGGFDENYDFLDVDVDYCVRMSEINWQVSTDSSLLAFHEGGGTTQAQRTRVLRFYKNRWYFLRKNKLINHPKLAKMLILSRLAGELLVIKWLGKFVFQSQIVRADKLLGRSELIRFCASNYR
jgi:GT2 family glycosyltransferase